MRKCAVPGCRSNHGKSYVPTFVFPRDEDRKKLWEKNIGCLGIKHSNNIGVCIKHFTEDCLIHSDMADPHSEDINARKKKVRLVYNAKPTIFHLSEEERANLHLRSKDMMENEDSDMDVEGIERNSSDEDAPCRATSSSSILSESRNLSEPPSRSKHDDRSTASISSKGSPKKRSLSVCSNSSSNESNETPKSPGVTKRRKLEKPPPTVTGRPNDCYCWICHKEGVVLSCIACPRAFHQRCAGEMDYSADWVCTECSRITVAENVDTRSQTLSEISLDKFCSLLKCCLNKMKCRAPAAFHQPVPVEYYSSYLDYVIHPMDLSLIEKNISQKLYGCTESFIADVKWIQHNSCVFNGAQHPLTVSARSLFKTCECDMSEIEVCPDCFLHACTRSKYWFSDVCRKPHPIVWAKLKGFPYWPAKVVRILGDNVDARFFGAHDRAWVPISQCYHLSKEMPTTSKPKKKGNYETALEELNIHVQLLIQKYGKFEYAPYRTPFNLGNKFYMYHGIDVDKLETKDDVVSGPNSQQLTNESNSNSTFSPSNMFQTHANKEKTAETKAQPNSFSSDSSSMLNSNSVVVHVKSEPTVPSGVFEISQPFNFDPPPATNKLPLETKMSFPSMASNLDAKKIESALERLKSYFNDVKEKEMDDTASETKDDELPEENAAKLPSSEQCSIKVENQDEPDEENSVVLQVESNPASAVPTDSLLNIKIDNLTTLATDISKIEPLNSTVNQVTQSPPQQNNVALPKVVYKEPFIPKISELLKEKPKLESKKEEKTIPESTSMAPKTNLFSRKLNEMIESCKAKLGITEFPEENQSDSSEDEEDEDENEAEEEESDNESESEAEDSNSEESTVEEEDSESSDKGDVPQTKIGSNENSPTPKTRDISLHDSILKIDLKQALSKKEESHHDQRASTTLTVAEKETMEIDLSIKSAAPNANIESTVKEILPEVHSVGKCSSPEKDKKMLLSSDESDTMKPLDKNSETDRPCTQEGLGKTDLVSLNRYDVIMEDKDAMSQSNQEYTSLADNVSLRNQLLNECIAAAKKDSEPRIEIAKSCTPIKEVDIIDVISSDSEAEKKPKTVTSSVGQTNDKWKDDFVIDISSDSDSDKLYNSNQVANNSAVRKSPSFKDCITNLGKRVEPSSDNAEHVENTAEEDRDESMDVCETNEESSNSKSNFAQTPNEDSVSAGAPVNSISAHQSSTNVTQNFEPLIPIPIIPKSEVVTQNGQIEESDQSKQVLTATDGKQSACLIKKEILSDTEQNEDAAPLAEKELKNEIQSLKEEVALLKTQLRKQEWFHAQEKRELRHNMNLIVMEMRASLKADKKEAIESLKQQHFGIEKSVSEVKMKQWCANCMEEAVFHCCWNTSYCSHHCQKHHWPKHRFQCTQVKASPTPVKTTGPIKIAKMPTASEMTDSAHSDKKVIVVNMKPSNGQPTTSAQITPVSSMAEPPKVQLITSKSQLQIVPKPISTGSPLSTPISFLPNTPVQLVLSPVIPSGEKPMSPRKNAPNTQKPPQTTQQDTSEIITKVRSRKTNLSTAIHLINKMTKETEDTLKTKTKEGLLEETPSDNLLMTEMDVCHGETDSSSGRKTIESMSDGDLEDAVLKDDEDDSPYNMVELGYGVMVCKKKLKKCVDICNTPSKLTRYLMGVMFPDINVLANCSVFGRKSNVTKETRPALPVGTIQAILDFVIQKYPTAVKSDLVSAMNVKCSEARKSLKRHECNKKRRNRKPLSPKIIKMEPDHKQEAEEEGDDENDSSGDERCPRNEPTVPANSASSDEVIPKPIVPCRTPVTFTSPSSVTSLPAVLPQFSRTVTTTLRTVIPNQASYHNLPMNKVLSASNLPHLLHSVKHRTIKPKPAPNPLPPVPPTILQIPSVKPDKLPLPRLKSSSDMTKKLFSFPDQKSTAHDSFAQTTILPLMSVEGTPSGENTSQPLVLFPSMPLTASSTRDTEDMPFASPTTSASDNSVS